MNGKYAKTIVYVLIIAAMLIGGQQALAQNGIAPSAPVGAAITYQGHLKQDGELITDTCDMQFGLYDAETTGTLVAGPLTVTNVAVTDGLFTVQLDFGASAFDGNARWLEIAVRCPAGSGEYATLNPRQALTSAPFATYATTSPWAGLLDVPAGFADGVDNNTTYSAGDGLTLNGTTFGVDEDWFTSLISETIIYNTDLFSGTYQLAVTGSCPSGSSISAINPDGSVVCETDDANNYQNVVVVAKSGGDYSTIQAAIDSISDATADNRYLVWVAPGVYVEQVTMKPYVDLVGAGIDLTTISYTGSSSATTGIVLAASHSNLSNLRIYGEGNAQAYLNGVYANGLEDVRVEHVAIELYTGTSADAVGVYGNSSDLVLEHMRIYLVVEGTGMDVTGVYGSAGTLEIVGGEIEGLPLVGGNGMCFGIESTGATIDVTGLTINLGEYPIFCSDARGISVESADASINSTHMVLYGVNAYGLLFLDGTGTYDVVLQDSEIEFPNTELTAGNTWGIYYHYGRSLRVANSRIYAGDSTGMAINVGIELSTPPSAAGNVYIDNTLIEGDIETWLYGDNGITVYVGGSKLSGSKANNGATTKCVASYNTAYDPLSSLCVP